MNWNRIETAADLEKIKQESRQHKVLIFKHSTRCSISAMALARLERAWKDSEMTDIRPYYLDLLAHRDLSNQLAADYGVTHESPQVLLIHQCKCVYHVSHNAIDYLSLKQIH